MRLVLRQALDWIGYLSCRLLCCVGKGGVLEERCRDSILLQQQVVMVHDLVVHGLLDLLLLLRIAVLFRSFLLLRSVEGREHHRKAHA